MCVQMQTLLITAVQPVTHPWSMVFLDYPLALLSAPWDYKYLTPEQVSSLLDACNI